jgi:hypothetical protein
LLYRLPNGKAHMKSRFDIGVLVDWHGGDEYMYIKKEDVALTTMALPSKQLDESCTKATQHASSY